jgi:hypothetical protein
MSRPAARRRASGQGALLLGDTGEQHDGRIGDLEAGLLEERGDLVDGAASASRSARQESDMASASARGRQWR